MLNEASAQLADLIGMRAHLLEALRREKDRAKKKLIEQKIKQVEELIEHRRSLFETFPSPDASRMPRLLCGTMALQNIFSAAGN